MRLPLTMLAAVLITIPAHASELTGTLQKVKETNRIVLGFQEASVPFSYLDGNQKAIGYAVDICMKIVDAVKRELKLSSLDVETSPVTSSNRIPLMMNGTVDLVCSATTNNAERQRQVAFTNSHFLSATRFAARKSDNITTIDQLKGKPVVAVAGSTNMVQLNQVNAARNLGITPLAAKDQAEAFLMLETGRAAAYVLDDVQLAVAIARSKDPSAYIISEEAFSKAEPYGIMLRRDDAAFKAVVDRATAELYRSPEIEAIYKKWFESPVPPNGLNFKTPMTRCSATPMRIRRIVPTPQATSADDTRLQKPRPLACLPAGFTPPELSRAPPRARFWLSATARLVSCPRCTLSPARRCGSSISARMPLPASARPNGSVALLSAWLDVTARRRACWRRNNARSRRPE
jgi:glutamate/aspartate transport system substrate-binding protein